MVLFVQVIPRIQVPCIWDPTFRLFSPFKVYRYSGCVSFFRPLRLATNRQRETQWFLSKKPRYCKFVSTLTVLQYTTAFRSRKILLPCRVFSRDATVVRTRKTSTRPSGVTSSCLRPRSHPPLLSATVHGLVHHKTIPPSLTEIRFELLFGRVLTSL